MVAAMKLRQPLDEYEILTSQMPFSSFPPGSGTNLGELTLKSNHFKSIPSARNELLSGRRASGRASLMPQALRET